MNRTTVASALDTWTGEAIRRWIFNCYGRGPSCSTTRPPWVSR